MFGAPGVGKGSQARILSETLRIPHISTGDIFRENVANRTELGMLVKVHMDNGALVPDEITIGLIMDRIGKADCKSGFILDGFPRTLSQVEQLERSLHAVKRSIDRVVNINLDDARIIDRLTGRRICPSCNLVYHVAYSKPHNVGRCNNCNTNLVQRIDDRESTIVRRLHVYHAQTEPVLSYCRSRYAVADVLSEDDIDDTTRTIFRSLGLAAIGTSAEGEQYMRLSSGCA
jgi:adenylate kinase